MDIESILKSQKTVIAFIKSDGVTLAQLNELLEEEELGAERSGVIANLNSAIANFKEIPATSEEEEGEPTGEPTQEESDEETQAAEDKVEAAEKLKADKAKAAKKAAAAAAKKAKLKADKTHTVMVRNEKSANVHVDSVQAYAESGWRIA